MLLSGGLLDLDQDELDGFLHHEVVDAPEEEHFLEGFVGLLLYENLLGDFVYFILGEDVLGVDGGVLLGEGLEGLSLHEEDEALVLVLGERLLPQEFRAAVEDGLRLVAVGCFWL